MPSTPVLAGSIALSSAGYCLIYLGLHRVLYGRLARAIWLLPTVLPCVPLAACGLGMSAQVLARLEAMLAILLWGVMFVQVLRCRERMSRFVLVVLITATLLLSANAAFSLTTMLCCSDAAGAPVGVWNKLTYLVMEVAMLATMSGLCAIHTERQFEHLACAANTDALTGLHNRRHFNEGGQDALRGSLGNRQRLWMLMIDIDHFKAINDRFGHAEGDRILQQVSRRLSESLRSSDIIARYGGEEFGILLPDTDAVSARHIADRLLAQVASLRAGPLADHPVTISIGAALCSDGEIDLDRFVQRADRALYQAKSNGRNCVVGLT